ncbi:MAG TPA: hypothetical protein VD689_03155 [Nitrosopumilaceae archaeon]|nr:hypothetical protein [Nitrosopumilaceae archaeon]
MKIKTDIRLFAALGILAVLVIAPLSSSVFAQSNSGDNDDSNKDNINEKKLQKESLDLKKEEIKKLREQLKEQKESFKELRGEKLREIKNIALENRIEVKSKIFDEVKISEPDREPDLSFRGETNGWTIVDGHAHKSSIVLSGHAFKASERMWKISTTGDIAIGDRKTELDLKGVVTGHKIMLQGNGILQNGEEVRLTLVGHYAPTTEDGVFAVAFTNGMLHNTNTGERLTMMQVGSVHVESIVSTPTSEPLDEDEPEEGLQ